MASRFFGLAVAALAFTGTVAAAQLPPISGYIDALIEPSNRVEAPLAAPAVAGVTASSSPTVPPAVVNSSSAATPPPATPPPPEPSPRPPGGVVDRDALVGALVGFSGKTNQQRQTYIAETLFPSAGLTDLHLQPVPYRGPWGEDYGNWDGLHNVIALRRGTLPDGMRRRIVVGGHYDKVTYPWRSPLPGHSDGILDNGSGVAVLALLAREFPQPQNDIVFVAMATEEPPPFFNGSKAYFGALSHDDLAQIAAYVNFDVLGRGYLAATLNSTPSLATAAAVEVEAAGLPFARVPVSTINNSDHLTALAHGIPALALTCTDYTSRDIHVPEDNLSVIDPETLYEQFRAARAALAAVDERVAAESGAVAAQKAG